MRTSSSVGKLLRSCLLLSPLFILATGCGSRQGAVSGKVSYKGKPLPGGDVRFFPEGGAGSFYAAIGSDGSYSIAKVPRGPAKISVTYSRESPLAKANPRSKAAAEKGLNQQREAMKRYSKGASSALPPSDVKSVPDKYAKPDQSGLKVDVTGGKQTFDIQLE
jgi:hypothetical protein